jgi:chromosomal replication initiator protein
MDNLAEIWRGVLVELQLTTSEANFGTWIRPLSLVSIEEQGEERLVATINCPSPYHQKTLSLRYAGQIQQSLSKLTGKTTEVIFNLGKSIQIDPMREEKAEDSPLFQLPQAGPTRTHTLNPRLTFESYVVGSSNNFAYAAAQGVVKSPGKKYNPLFIYGGVGLGKTHLMHAIGHALLSEHPELQILYISTETFGNELVASLQSKKTVSFKKRYRSADVLLVDDIQFISGKEYIQEEFFHTFNELYMSERQIILTSDRPPQEIAKIEERLTSRFLGGLTVDIQPPDYEMRVAILTQKAKEMELTLPPETIAIIAERTATNARELEGIFRRIVALADSKKTQITVELVQNYFGVEKEQRVSRLRPTTIINKTAQYFAFKTTDLIGNSRKAPLVNARHIAMYLMKKELEMPHEQIGEALGGRDHTTVMHAVEKITATIGDNMRISRAVAEIKQLLLTS